jgi:hypothetical protein
MNWQNAILRGYYIARKIQYGWYELMPSRFKIAGNSQIRIFISRSPATGLNTPNPGSGRNSIAAIPRPHFFVDIILADGILYTGLFYK